MGWMGNGGLASSDLCWAGLGCVLCVSLSFRQGAEVGANGIKASRGNRLISGAKSSIRIFLIVNTTLIRTWT